MEKKYFNEEDVISIGKMIRDNKELSVEEIISIYKEKSNVIHKAKMWLGRQKYYHKSDSDIMGTGIRVAESVIHMIDSNPNCLSEKDNTIYIKLNDNGEQGLPLATFYNGMIEIVREQEAPQMMKLINDLKQKIDKQ